MKYRFIFLLGVLACFGTRFGSNAIAGVPEVTTIHTPMGVTSFSMAQTGRLGAGITPDGKLCIWNLPEGRLLRTIEMGTTNLNYPVPSTDGLLCLTSSSSGDLAVWNTTTGEAVFKLQLGVFINAAAFSRDNRYLALSVMNGPVQLYELAGKTKHFELGHVMGGTQGLMFSPDDKLIATADSDTLIRIYGAQTGKLLASNADFLGEAFSVDFTPDGKQVIAAGADKFAVFLDAATGTVTKKLKKQKEPVGPVRVSGDGKLVATVLFNSAKSALPAPVLIWETGSGHKRSDWLPPSGVVGSAWAPDGHFLAATLTPDAVHVWQVF